MVNLLKRLLVVSRSLPFGGDWGILPAIPSVLSWGVFRDKERTFALNVLGNYLGKDIYPCVVS